MKPNTQISRDKTFFLPVNTGYYENGLPTEECLTFYKARCNNRIHCAIVGNIATIHGFVTNERTGRISRDTKWNQLSNIIKENGVLPGIQLASTWLGYIGQKNFIANNWAAYKEEVKTLLLQIDIPKVIADFRESIIISIEKGFQHVQIHAAHGYLLSSLLDPHLSEYTCETVTALIQIANDFADELEISLRVSAYCGFSDEIEADRLLVIESLFCKGFSYIDLSEGYYNYDKKLIYPSTPQEKQERVKRSLLIAGNFPSQDFIISGGGSFQHHNLINIHRGYCRSIIANPNFNIVHDLSCKLCGECHYYTLGRDKLTCSMWE